MDNTDGLKDIFESKDERNDFYIALVVICLFLLAFSRFIGCNADTLGLGIGDNNEVAMTEALLLHVADNDGDGIPDIDDFCPEVAGLAEFNGCPSDKDGDGIADAEDACPDYKGTVENNGCPADTDGDGVHDGIDDCPEVSGVVDNNGCPADTDKDGIPDDEDKCPDLAGVAVNQGCPEVVLAPEDKVILNEAMKSVEFETGLASLKGSSTNVLNQIAGLLNKYPSYSLKIEGHTDNTSDSAKNIQLSKDRARACYDYLLSQGVKSYRLQHTGYGQSRPIADNATPEGRQTNRRVEFSLNY
jgi:OmpA-OmpF porin, OOP family